MRILTGCMALGLTFLSGNLSAQLKNAQPGPQISFEEKSHNFGDIREDMKYATHRFVFKNTGTKDLFISTVQTSCGCTTPDWTRDTIHPGKSGFVDAKYETIGRIGSFNKTITVYSNAVNAPFVHLDISGNVLKEIVNQDPQPVDYGQIVFSKPTVDFGTIYDNGTDTQELRVTNGTMFTTNFNPVTELPSYCQLLGMPSSLEPNESARIRVVIDNRKIKNYGFGAFQIPISTDNSVAPYLGLYVAYNRKQYFPKLNARELARAPKLVTDKKLHDFGNGESGDIFNTEFTFTNTGKTDLIIHEIYPECACIKVEYSKNVLKPGESMTVKMRFDTGIKKGKTTQSIWIVCNDPVEPERYLYLTAKLPDAPKTPGCATCPK